jgi:pimeloyl-ACP methyl ester carboxylesterase
MCSPKRDLDAKLFVKVQLRWNAQSVDGCVVLHGAYMSTELMKPVIDGFAKDQQGIAVDLQGHGQTADADRPIAYEKMAVDVAALIQTPGVQEAVLQQNDSVVHVY